MASSGGWCRCGSELPSPDAVGLVTCRSCGTVSRSEESVDGALVVPPPSGFDGTSSIDERVGWIGRSLETDTAARRARGCGLAALAVVFLVALAIAAVGFNRARTSPDRAAAGRSNRIVIEGSVVSLDDGDPSDVIAVVQDYTGASHRYLARLRVGGGRISEQWTSPELPQGIDRALARRAGDGIVVAFGDQIWNLDAARGTRRWNAALSDQVDATCARCLVVIGDRVVVRTADAYLSGFSIGAPASPWRRRLASSDATVEVLDGRLVAVDESPDAPGATVRSVDPATGQDSIVFRPTCPSPDPAKTPVLLSLDDAVRSVPGTGDAVSTSAYGDGCVVRWEVATGTRRWATRIEGLTSVASGSVLVSPTDLVFASAAGQVGQVDLATGAARMLDAGPGVQARPASLIGRRLLAWTTTGTEEHGLAALDLAQGRQEWSIDLADGAVPLGASTPVALDADAAHAVLVIDRERAVLATFRGEDLLVGLAPIDLATGITGSTRSLPLRTRYAGSVPLLTVESKGSGQLLATIDTALAAIDVGSGWITTYP